MKKILVTGATGFIGKNIVEKIKDEYEILAPSSDELDLLNEEKVEAYLLENRFDVVIHAATINTTRRVVTHIDVLDGNLRMYSNLERCHDLYGKMIYFGSGAEYDCDHYIPFMKEEYLDCHIPKDSYGFSKYLMAKSCQYVDNVYELCLFGVYGKYEEWERRFISNAICRALKGLDITIQRNVYFDYLWIDDLVWVLKWFIDKTFSYKRINLCRGEHIDLFSLAKIVKEQLGIDCDIRIKESGYKLEYSGNNDRLKSLMPDLKFSDYKTTINELISFYKDIINEIDESRLI